MLIRQLISDETIVIERPRRHTRKTLERLEDATVLGRFHRERSLERHAPRRMRTRLLPRADKQHYDLGIDQLERAGYLNIV